MRPVLVVMLVACGHSGPLRGTPGDATSPDATTAPTGPTELVNVLRAGGDWPISGGVAVAWSGTTVATYDPATGAERGHTTLPAQTISVVGTGDLNGDGLADVASVQTAPGAMPCATGALDRTLTILSGADPSVVLYTSSPLPDACISLNGAAPSAYISVWDGALDIGAPGALALAPQYYSEGWFLDGGGGTFYTAETAAFASYTAARPMLQPSAQGNSYAPFQQPLNGMIATIAGQPRYVATTSGRFLQFAIAPLSASQLIADSPFLARPDIVGRNYGLLEQDTGGDPGKISLIAGTAANDLYSDVMAGSASNTVTGTDLWAAIERHVSVLDAPSGAVVQKFYSYAHDDTDGDTYRNRITYPSYAKLPAHAGPSRLIYNVFDGSTWNIQITEPGGVQSATILAGYYVWDVIPRGADEVDVLASPIDTGRVVEVPDHVVTGTSTVGSWRAASYFPQLTTTVFRWTRDHEQLEQLTSFAGIPRLDLGFPRRATESASSGRLFPSLRAVGETGQVVLLIRDANLAPAEHVIDW